MAQIIQWRRSKTKVLVLVVGSNNKVIALLIHLVFMVLSSRQYQLGVTLGFVRINEVLLGGDLITRADDDIRSR